MSAALPAPDRRGRAHVLGVAEPDRLPDTRKSRSLKLTVLVTPPPYDPEGACWARTHTGAAVVIRGRIARHTNPYRLQEALVARFACIVNLDLETPAPLPLAAVSTENAHAC